MPILARQGNVEEHKIDQLRPGDGHALLTRAGGEQGVPIRPHCAMEEPQDRRFVFDGQYSHGAIMVHLKRCCCWLLGHAG
jgi:hypothetical protein